MAKYKADIVIYGAGIAGLWLHHRLRKRGYNVILLESDSIGGFQSVASQGILHSGLKYAFAGKVNKLAQSISAMPDRWRACLRGEGEIDLRAAEVATESQLLMIPSGLMGGLIKLVTGKVLGGSVRQINKSDWPEEIKASGFKGQIVYMDEPVLNVPSLVRALAEPYRDSIKRADDAVQIEADYYIYTAAKGNEDMAVKAGHDLKVQHRPLLMGMLRPAPHEMYAHLVGPSDKPVATITSHIAENGDIVWYLGGGVAERAKDSDPEEVYEAARKGFAKYMPELDLSNVRWSVLPIDRVEGKSNVEGHMPDTPTIHAEGNKLYCWPTKLTFAPMLADKILGMIGEPSGEMTDWSDLEDVEYRKAPWDA